MVICTREFGPVEAGEEEIYQFTSPLYGFEQQRRFLLLTDPALPDLGWLQSIEDAKLCFVVVKAQALSGRDSPSYQPAFPDCSSLGAGQPDCWVLLTLDENNQATVNLRTPVLLNPGTRRAMQVVLEDRYPLRQPFLGKAV